MGEAARQAPTTPARVRLRRVAAVIAGCLMLTGVVQAPPSHAEQVPAAAPQAGGAGTRSASGTAPARPGTGSETAAVSLTSLTPAAPSEDDTLTITGTVTNRGKSTITGSHVAVRIGSGGQPLTSRSGIQAVSKRTAFVIADGPEVADHRGGLDDIPPGVSRPFTLKVPMKDLDLGGNGVYQLSVTLSGTAKAVAFPQILGIERTFLPWYPDAGKPEQTQIALAWPLIGKARMDARTDSDEQQTPVFRDDELTAELAPGGRLQQLVSIGRRLPVTWVVDPDLLATVEAMAKGYRVAEDTGLIDTATGQATADETGGTGGDTRPGTGTDVAMRWLKDLKESVEDGQVVALPFGDPDLASIAHQGKNVPGTLEHLKSATELAVFTTETVLGVRPRTDIAWPTEGALDTSIVGVARAGGADKVIAASASLGSGSLSRTPNSVRPIGAGTTALVADDVLSRAFTGDMSRAGNSTVAVQNFLAQSLMVTMEAPNDRRSILVAPQRNLGTSAAQALAEAFTTARTGKWISPVGIGTIESAEPDPRADRTVPGPRAYPERLRKQELTPSVFRQVQETQAELEGFLVILSEKDRVVTPLGTAILRSMSDSWRGDPAGAEAYRSSVHEYLTGLKGLVRIVEKSKNTLSGSSGTLQVTVENNLTQKVTVKLQLSSALPYRFKIDDGQGFQTVTIEGERKKTLKFPTTATASGIVQVTAQLHTPDETLYGEPMQFQVNVTSVTGTVLAVIACGMLLLVLAGARMYRQRKRTAPLARDGGQDGGDEAAGTGGDDEDGGGRVTDGCHPGTGPPPAGLTAGDGADTGTCADPRPVPAGAGKPEDPHGSGAVGAADGSDAPGAAEVPDEAGERAGTAGNEPAAQAERPSGQPGDPEPDTVPESGVRHVADEKVER